MGVEFGRRLKELRKKKNLTQAELAKLCGLGESTISFYESCKREPNFEVLLCLAEKIDTTPNYLLTGKYSTHWWEDEVSPIGIELEKFIKEQPDLLIFGEPINDATKRDLMIALRAAWEALKSERAAQDQPKEGK